MERESEGMVPNTTIGIEWSNAPLSQEGVWVCEGDVRAASSEMWQD